VVPPLLVDNKEGGDDKEEISSTTTTITTTFANWMDITQLDTPEEAIQIYQRQRQ